MGILFGLVIFSGKYSKYLLHYIISVVAIIGFAILVFYIVRVHNNAVNWAVGIGGYKLINDGIRCTVPVPTYIQQKIREGFFDYNYNYPEGNQINFTVEFDSLPESLRNKPNLKYLGFPRVERYNFSIASDEFALNNYVRENMIDMEDPSVPQDIKDNIEFIVDVTDPKRHLLKWEIKKNITRSNEQKKLRDKILAEDKRSGNKDRLDYNVLILFVDNIARSHFTRMMKKTVNWMSQHVNNDTSNYDVFQFMRYHTVFPTSRLNNNAMFYGQTGLIYDTSASMFDAFQNNGYMTGVFREGCEITFGKYNVKQVHPSSHTYDHFAGNFAGDSNYDYNIQEHRLKIYKEYCLKGKASVYKSGIYGQGIEKMSLEYVEKFWETYPDNRKIFMGHYTNAHESYGELVKYFDNDLANFLEDFRKKGYLKDTIIQLYSDHGAHTAVYDYPYIPDNSRLVESTHPLFTYIVPKTLPSRNRKILFENQQNFMSPYDAYSSLITIAKGKTSRSKHTISYPIIAEVLPLDRDCTNTTMFLGPCWCYMDSNLGDYYLNKMELFRFETDVWNTSNRYNAKEIF